jgi:hemoglobin-like flavoprotein
MLSVIVGRLDNLEELTEEIKQLAIRHVQYGVKEQHYKAVGAALLWTLQQGLGKDWDEEVKEAWASCFNILSSTMINASGYKNRRIA